MTRPLPRLRLVDRRPLVLKDRLGPSTIAIRVAVRRRVPGFFPGACLQAPTGAILDALSDYTERSVCTSLSYLGLQEPVVGFSTLGHAWGDAESSKPNATCLIFPGPTDTYAYARGEVGRGRCVVNLRIPRTLSRAFEMCARVVAGQTMCT